MQHQHPALSCAVAKIPHIVKWTARYTLVLLLLLLLMQSGIARSLNFGCVIGRSFLISSAHTILFMALLVWSSKLRTFIYKNDDDVDGARLSTHHNQKPKFNVLIFWLNWIELHGSVMSLFSIRPFIKQIAAILAIFDETI